MSISSRSFWKQTLERAIKTAAQTAVALLTVDGVIGIIDVNWGQSASVVGLATVVSILTSIVSEPFGPGDSPSAV